MNLHDAPVVMPAEPEPEIDGTCPNCGSGRWYREERGTYAEDHIVAFPGGHQYWNNHETIEVHDTDPWKCYDCDFLPDDDLSDWIHNNT